MKQLLVVLVLVMAACGNAEPVVESDPEMGKQITVPAPSPTPSSKTTPVEIPTPLPTLTTEFDQLLADLLHATVEGATPEETEAMAACTAASLRADSQSGIVFNLIELVVADIRATGREPSGPGWDLYVDSFLEAIELSEAEEQAWAENPEELLVGLTHLANQAFARSMSGIAIWSAWETEDISRSEASLAQRRLMLLAEQSAILVEQLNPCLA